jgi:hypothetical protein
VDGVKPAVVSVRVRFASGRNAQSRAPVPGRGPHA